MGGAQRSRAGDQSQEVAVTSRITCLVKSKLVFNPKLHKKKKISSKPFVCPPTTLTIFRRRLRILTTVVWSIGRQRYEAAMKKADGKQEFESAAEMRWRKESNPWIRDAFC